MSANKTRKEWKLSELAAEAGVSPRTVRYYVQRGLLPAPPFKGPDTTYGEEHLLRLKAIRALQARFLPLEAIQVELLRLSPEQLRELAESPPAPAPALPPASPPPPTRASSPAPHMDESPRERHPLPGASSWQRWELAPGLELHLADSADDQTRALAERLRALSHER